MKEKLNRLFALLLKGNYLLHALMIYFFMEICRLFSMNLYIASFLSLVLIFGKELIDYKIIGGKIDRNDIIAGLIGLLLNIVFNLII